MPKHIKRLISVFGLFIILFLILHHILKPSSFGEIGHYRALSIEENSDQEIRYAGLLSCSSCHDSIRILKAEGFHAGLNCELCHGPGLKHALFAGRFNDVPLPDSLKLPKPAERNDCAVCHQMNEGRIKKMSDTIDVTLVHQVNVMEHNLMSKKTKKERKCISCHNPHQP